ARMIFISGGCIVKNNKILLVQTTKDSKQPNKWGPPAGHAESNESLRDCAIREIKEETGLVVKLTGLVQANIAHYKGNDYAIVFYYANIDSGKGIKIQKTEVKDHAWVSLEDLKSDKYPLRKKFLKDT